MMMFGGAIKSCGNKNRSDKVTVDWKECNTDENVDSEKGCWVEERRWVEVCETVMNV